MKSSKVHEKVKDAQAQLLREELEKLKWRSITENGKIRILKL